MQSEKEFNSTQGKKEITNDDFRKLGCHLLSIGRKDVIDGITHMAEILNQERDDSYYIADAFVDAWDYAKENRPGELSQKENAENAANCFIKSTQLLQNNLGTCSNDEDKHKLLSLVRERVLKICDDPQMHKHSACISTFFADDFWGINRVLRKVKNNTDADTIAAKLMAMNKGKE